MSFEVGGRADKFGNRFEDRWVVKQLLRLVEEEISSVTLEAVGEAEKGIDLWVKNKDGTRVCYQCKARNASLEYWRMGDLAAKGMFKDAKRQLDTNENITYQFVSAVTNITLNGITNRARNSSDNPNDFYESQIMNAGSEVIKAYKK